MKIFQISFIITILLTSCITSKKTEDTNNDTACESMTYNSSPVNNISTDYYQIDTVFINNDCLNIWVSYSGGCGDADFKLYYSDRVKQSYPPQASLRLQLIDNDPCRAIVQQKLFYNLSFFEDNAIEGGIIFNIVDYDKKIMYKK